MSWFYRIDMTKPLVYTLRIYLNYRPYRQINTVLLHITMNLILLAIPFFIVLIAMELAVDRYRGTGYYRMNDSIFSLNAGIFSRVTIIFWRLAPVAVYYYVYQNWSVTELPVSGITWVVAFVSYDFFY